MIKLPFLPNPVGPPWLPASVTEARKWAYYGVLFVFIIMVIMFVLAIVTFIFAPVWAIGTIAGLVVSAVILFLVKMTVFDHLDQGRFKDASTFMLIWGILGLISALIPGILI
ncbi:MAG TPA: hypothetical protein VLH13_04625, partial [Methanomassiliicoccales archaeon]|nr:hypothetical protein [Methanomassiliicoccales archaeon]